MPDPVRTIIQGSFYTIPILNEEMNNVRARIDETKNEIASLNERMKENITNLNDFNKQLLCMYIRETGEYPPIRQIESEPIHPHGHG